MGEWGGQGRWWQDVVLCRNIDSHWVTFSSSVYANDTLWWRALMASRIDHILLLDPPDDRSPAPSAAGETGNKDLEVGAVSLSSVATIVATNRTKLECISARILVKQDGDHFAASDHCAIVADFVVH
mmetsp:Transcript_63631/g.93208  ORF Transcript_63631/g.93208 Transcript_63631/m.93208 type:complete len:127 (-) Transcript_63631:6-386(-)